MKIIDIKESGCSNILMWALTNGADIKSDDPLISLINDETFYLVTLGDVNFFELLRLTQIYRNKLRIRNEYPASIPPRKDLKLLFPGEEVIPNPEEGEKPSISYAELGEGAISKFMALVSQMTADDDIIPSGAVRLFLPMITRRFDVQIPVSFIDLIQSMNDDEIGQLFNQDYPNSIQTIIDAEIHGFKHTLGMLFVRGTQIIKYDARYDKYLKSIKYAPLKTYPHQDRLYKFALIGFFKKDNISRTEIKCSLFKPSNTVAAQTLKRIGTLNTPLELEFVVQMPLHYVQLMENSFDREELDILYESSMSNIIENGLVFENFKSTELDPENEENSDEIGNFMANIDSYRIRIAESNEMLVKTIKVLLNGHEDVDVTSVFSMLPSIYMMNCVIRINSEKIQALVNHTDPIISEMFQEMSAIVSSVNDDIRKAK